MAVPRRLLVERDRHGRPGPRFQDRGQLHQRAAPLRDVQQRRGRLLLHAPDRRARAGRSRRSRETAGSATSTSRSGRYLDLRAGRLAGVRPAHAEPGTALRPGDGRADRSVEEPELPGAAGGRTRGPVRRASTGLEDFGKEPRDDRNNIQPRAGLRLRRARDRHGRHPRRMGRVPGFRLHELERAVRGDRRRRARPRRDLLGQQHGRDPEGRRDAVPRRRSDFHHRRARTRRTRPGFRCSARSGRRAWSSPTPGRRTSDGRTS